MKKFTKGCLITALVLFIVGLIICGVGGLLGGFRELSEMDGIGSIPFRYYRNVESDWIGFYDEKELERLENIEDIENMADWKSAELEGKKEQLALTADTLGSITIDLKECNLVIRESADEHVWIERVGRAACVFKMRRATGENIGKTTIWSVCGCQRTVCWKCAKWIWERVI